MDRTVVHKTTLAEQGESFCLALSPDERLRVLEDLNRQGRILVGYPASVQMDRKIARAT